MSLVKENRQLFLILLGGFIIRFILSILPISTLLSKLLDDDAFYYFSLVKNWVQGNGIVFNQGIPTNGFHPLYAILLYPIFKLTLPLGINLPIHLSLLLLSIIDTATIFLIYKIVTKLTNQLAGLFSAFFWAFNPWVFFTSLIGVEMPLQIFLMALLILAFLNLNEKVWAPKSSIIIGSLMALTFLARMDSVFLCFSIFISILVNRSQSNKFKTLTLILSSAILVTLPWFIFSIVKVNSILPISSAANRLLRLMDHSLLFWIVGAIYVSFSYLTLYFTNIILPIPFNVFQIVLILGFLFLLVKNSFRNLQKLKFLLLTVFLYYNYYWFYQLALRRWYSLFSSFLLTLLISITIFEKIPKDKVNRLFVGLSILFMLNFFCFYSVGNSPTQNLRFEISSYVNENLPNSNIGSFNSGVLQYYINSDVINLDGVMNPLSLSALKKNEIEDFIISQKLDYLVESEEDLGRLNMDFQKISLTSVKTFNQTEPIKPYLRFFNEPSFKTQVFHLFLINVDKN